MILAKEEYIRINGTNLAYYENGSGNIILFLHGNSSDSYAFYNMYKYFSKQNKVIAVDSRGHGKSSTGSIPYSIRLLAADIIRFCEEKKLKKINVVGYSDGGNIALVMAVKKPELIDKLIIISANNKASGLKAWFRSGVGLYKLGLEIIKIIKIKSNNKTQFKLWRMNLMLKDIGVSMKDLSKLNVETLIIGAENDVIYRRHLFKIHKNIKNSILKIIKNTNHFNILLSEKTMEYINEFIKEQ
ncbi:MAG: alpha/beta hydrolase [Clostridium perfringens]|nr:alpha/beta hydrolase [Clostridium perfringens]